MTERITVTYESTFLGLPGVMSTCNVCGATVHPAREEIHTEFHTQLAKWVVNVMAFLEETKSDG